MTLLLPAELYVWDCITIGGMDNESGCVGQGPTLISTSCNRDVAEHILRAQTDYHDEFDEGPGLFEVMWEHPWITRVITDLNEIQRLCDDPDNAVDGYHNLR
jgi:hypothetical protein